MEMTNNVTYTDRYLSKEIKVLMEETAETLHDAVYEQLKMFGTLNDVESKSRDGFWSSTDGGVSLSIPLSLTRMEGTGNTPTYMEKYLAKESERATGYTNDEIGAWTEENEDEWCEEYDAWLEDGTTVWLTVNTFYYDASNEGEGKTSIYMSVACKDDYGHIIPNIELNVADAQKQIELTETPTIEEVTETLEILANYLKPFMEL